MKFKYNAKTQEGELQTGFIDSSGRDTAINILKSHNLYILSLEKTETTHWYDAFFRFFGRVKIKDLMLFTRQFSILLDAQVPINEALRSLYRQTTKPFLKEAIMEVMEDVEAGLSLSQALERRSDIFSDFYVNMLRPAEITGRLDQAIIYLADYLEKESIWISRLRNSMIYPIFLVAMFLIVAGIMVVVVFPQLKPVFDQSGIRLPIYTRVLLNAGDFVAQWWFAILFIIALTVIMFVDYFKSQEGRIVSHELKIKLPVIGALYRKIYVARFAESVSILMKGGVPLTQSLEIAGRSIQNVVYAEILHEIAEGIKQGQLLSSMLLEYEPYFPQFVTQLVTVGESAGRMDEVLEKAAKIYTREVNDTLDNLIEVVQPVMIVFIGVFVGLLFASILLPIYNLARSL